VQGIQELSLKKRGGGSSGSFFQNERPESAVKGDVLPDNNSSPVSEEKSGNFIRALRVGFFKSAVKEGDVLQEGQLFGHISAMNIRHEQKVLHGGTVKAVLVVDGDGVAYGDPIIELE
jgi:biotin carboxyl carrier protein